MDPFVEAIGKTGGFALAAAILAYAIYTQRDQIGKAIGAWALRRRAHSASSVVAELNGKLLEAVGKAIEPLMEEAIDRRFKEMPEFMREKIKALGEHGANQALNVFLLEHSPQWNAIEAKTHTIAAETRSQTATIDQAKVVMADLTAAVSDLGASVARIEGFLDRPVRSPRVGQKRGKYPKKR